jgi:NAD(P)-dependent dehydrogenase (short-subunit alcohol dehydrogenase family)
VTGATAGIGLETARGLAREGATVVLVGRDPDKCRRAVDDISERTRNPNVSCLVADLSAQTEIRRLAGEIEERCRRVHVLVNNVGGLFLNRQASVDGIEMTLALNHLGPYLLTRLLCPLLTASAPARIVNVSSFAHLGARLDPSLSRRVSANACGAGDWSFAGWKGYQQSKLANILFTYEIARRLEGTGVTANALSPGLVASNFGLNNHGMLPMMRPLWNWAAASCEKGATTSVYLAGSAEVEGVTGKYFTRCRPRRSSAASYDRATAAELWSVSASRTGLAAN